MDYFNNKRNLLLAGLVCLEYVAAIILLGADQRKLAEYLAFRLCVGCCFFDIMYFVFGYMQGI